MIATLTGMGIVLCGFLLVLLLVKPKRVLGDAWLAVWLGLYLTHFIAIAAAIYLPDGAYWLGGLSLTLLTGLLALKRSAWSQGLSWSAS